MNTEEKVKLLSFLEAKFKLNDNDSDLYNNLACLYFEMGKKQQSLNLFEEGSKKFPYLDLLQVNRINTLSTSSTIHETGKAVKKILTDKYISSIDSIKKILTY